MATASLRTRLAPTPEPDSLDYMATISRTRRLAGHTLRQARRLIVLVVGTSVLAIGVAMIVLPGPAFIVIPVGLGILGTEFLWARSLLHNLKERGSNLVRGKATKKSADC